MSETRTLPPINVEEIRREIQRRHLLPISETDPVLAVATMIDLVTERSLARFLAVLDDALGRVHAGAVEAGESIVNRGADHLVQQVADALGQSGTLAADALGRVSREIETTMQATLEEQRRLVSQGRRAALFATIGGVALLLAGVIAAGIQLGNLIGRL